MFRLKREMPDLEVVLNGGIATLDDAGTALRRVDGVMLGRAAWKDLWLLAGVDRRLFGDTAPPPERADVARRYLAHAKHDGDARLGELVRPLLGLCHAVPGARQWRRALGDLVHRPDTTIDVVARTCERLAPRPCPGMETGRRPDHATTAPASELGLVA